MPPGRRSIRHKIKREDDDEDSSTPETTSDESSDSDVEAYVTVWLGLTAQQLRNGGGRANFPEYVKTLIFREALRQGYVGKNLPTPAVLSDMAQQVGLPLNHGKRIADLCLNKLIDWIYTNLTSAKTGGLIKEKSVGRLGQKEQWDVKVSAALVRAVESGTFSYARDILGQTILEQHQREVKYHPLQVMTGIGKTELLKETMGRLLPHITKTPKAKPTPRMPRTSGAPAWTSPTASYLNTSGSPATTYLGTPPAMSTHCIDANSFHTPASMPSQHGYWSGAAASAQVCSAPPPYAQGQFHHGNYAPAQSHPATPTPVPSGMRRSDHIYQYGHLPPSQQPSPYQGHNPQATYMSPMVQDPLSPTPVQRTLADRDQAPFALQAPSSPSAPATAQQWTSTGNDQPQATYSSPVSAHQAASRHPVTSGRNSSANSDRATATTPGIQGCPPITTRASLNNPYIGSEAGPVATSSYSSPVSAHQAAGRHPVTSGRNSSANSDNATATTPGIEGCLPITTRASLNNSYIGSKAGHVASSSPVDELARLRESLGAMDLLSSTDIDRIVADASCRILRAPPPEQPVSPHAGASSSHGPTLRASPQALPSDRATLPRVGEQPGSAPTIHSDIANALPSRASGSLQPQVSPRAELVLSWPSGAGERGADLLGLQTTSHPDGSCADLLEAQSGPVPEMTEAERASVCHRVCHIQPRASVHSDEHATTLGSHSDQQRLSHWANDNHDYHQAPQPDLTHAASYHSQPAPQPQPQAVPPVLLPALPPSEQHGYLFQQSTPQRELLLSTAALQSTPQSELL
ncbi:hypothetical protein AC578_7038 [Pseudocercospora eumusae]|uniref:Uncharacterized protein n=1 Tax=Pseudocercospora eumusae TaxID=321146 RepID=A0A139GVU8_9PEZI|nr:hypothetical protein AC578_7038 [Pseudocercospora eumusae]